MSEKARWLFLVFVFVAVVAAAALLGWAYPVRVVGEPASAGSWRVRLYSGPTKVDAWTATEIWQTAPDGLQFKSIDGARWRISGTWSAEEVRP